MESIRDVFWILLVNGTYCLNSGNTINVDETSSMSLPSKFSTSQTLCDPAVTNISTIVTSNRSRASKDGTSCMLNTTESREEMIDFDTQNKIKYYNSLEKRIWRFFPPIFLGKE